MTDPRPLQSARFDATGDHRRALGALLALLAFHVWATWGYVGSYYAEPSAWMHEVERFTAGQTPYRDFDWPYPPLAIWVLGSLARILGTGVAGLSAIMTVILLLMAIAYQRLVARIAPGVGTAAVVTAFVFATAYAARFGPPLPAGGISPAGPLGMLFLLVGVGMVIRLGDTPAPKTSIAAGVALGLAALCRQDFWLPAVFLVVWGMTAVRHAPHRAMLRACLAAGTVAVFLSGTIIAFGAAGSAALEGIFPRGAYETLVRTLPSLERLIMEAAAASAMGIAGVVALWLCFAIDDARAFRLGLALMVLFLSACAVHLGMSVATARDILVEGLPASPTTTEETIARVVAVRSPLRAAVFLLDQRFQAHLFPALLLPVLLGVLLARWRQWGLRRDRDLALLMLGLAVMLRARRGFAGTDWPNVLVEIPAYALFLHLVAAAAGRSAQRAVSMALAILFVVGLYTYYNLGVGPLTQRRFPASVTVRGTVRWDPGTTADYRTWSAVFDSLDGGRHRPLLAFGPSGAWNYFFARENPTPFTRGFLSDADADSAAAAVRAAEVPPIVVDTRAVVRIARFRRPALLSWENRPSGGLITLLDVPALSRVLTGCRMRPGIPSEPGIPVYDCGDAARQPADSAR